MNRSNPGRNMTRAVRAVTVIAALGAGTAGAAEWQHTLTPYLWMSAMEGNTTVGSPLGPLEADVDMTFSDLLDNLDAGGMLAYKGQYGKFVLLGDLIYMDLGANGSRSATVPGGTATTDTSIDVSQTAFEVDLGYHVTDELALFIGARYMDIQSDAQVDVSGPAMVPSSRTAGASADWIDPVVGLLGEFGLTERWAVILKADIGGFDLGSKFAWEVLSSLRYRATEHLDISAGYRYFVVDYESDDATGVLNYDMTISGPGIGFSFRF